jgi:hypothetical protein
LLFPTSSEWNSIYQPQDATKKVTRSERASSSKGKGQEDSFINDDSESGDEEGEEEAPVASSKQTATTSSRKGRKRLAAALDSDSEEEQLFAKKPETVKPDRCCAALQSLSDAHLDGV